MKEYFARFKYLYITLVVILVVTIAATAVYMTKQKAAAANKGKRMNTECLTDERVFDYADVLTDAQEDDLRELIAEKEKEVSLDIVLVTLNEDVGSSDDALMEYADQFYEDNKFGYDKPIGDGVIYVDNYYDRYVWFTDSKTDISSLIPTVTPSTPLVAIYDSTNEMPDKWYLEKYTNRGYTIGAHISLDEDDTMLLQGNEMLTSTSAAKVLGNIVGKDDLYEIHEISGSPVLPVDNVDNNMNILLGTEKNKLYTLKFFRGTKEEVADIYADTRIFQSSKYVELNSPFKKTSKGYFIINLPMNLDDGYYYLSDIGFFKYIGKK